MPVVVGKEEVYTGQCGLDLTPPRLAGSFISFGKDHKSDELVANGDAKGHDFHNARAESRDVVHHAELEVELEAKRVKELGTDETDARLLGGTPSRADGARSR